MKFGVFADVHGNLEALKAVLSFYSSRKIARFLCAGDLVGYGPNPNECVELVRALKTLKIVAGNHDWAACGMRNIAWFNDYARKAILWTRKVLDEDNQIYLSELPRIVRYTDFVLVHGSPRDPLNEYLITQRQFEDNAAAATASITWVGHSHLPLAYCAGSDSLISLDGPVVLSLDEQYFVNPGSVGQPRDGNSFASCGIYDNETRQFELFRLPYDIAATQKKMRHARLPAFLMERLNWGK